MNFLKYTNICQKVDGEEAADIINTHTFIKEE